MHVINTGLADKHRGLFAAMNGLYYLEADVELRGEARRITVGPFPDMDKAEGFLCDYFSIVGDPVEDETGRRGIPAGTMTKKEFKALLDERAEQNAKDSAARLATHYAAMRKPNGRLW